MTPSERKIMKVLDGMTYRHATRTLKGAITELVIAADDMELTQAMAIMLRMLAEELEQEL